MMDQMENNSPFYVKKIIIRNDDVGDFRYFPSLQWISNLAIKKDIKVTYAVIPVKLINNSETTEYLNSLDRGHFEFATHGYEHTDFKGYELKEQYSLIENGTLIMEEYLYNKPYTFVPPYGSSDVNTTKACRLLGYNSITDMFGQYYVVNFESDFEYDASYYPTEHHTFEDFKRNFDIFYNSSDEYYVLYLHDWTFLNNEGKLDEEKADRFEKVIDYIKSKNVNFMTIEEAYEWYVDENTIRTGMINESYYFIDLKESRYNHTMNFNSPFNADEIYLKDVTTGEEAILYKNAFFEFSVIKGHFYEIYEM